MRTVSSCSVKSSHAWIDRLKHWSYTCNFVAFHYNFLWGCNILAVIFWLYSVPDVLWYHACRKPEQRVQFSTRLEFSYQWWWNLTNETLLPKILPTSRWLCESEKHQLAMVIHSHLFDSVSVLPTHIFLLPFSYSHMPTLQNAFTPPDKPISSPSIQDKLIPSVNMRSCSSLVVMS